MELIIGILLLVAAVFLVVSILFQSSKSHKLPGTIAGGAETFFGKAKGTTIDRVLSKVTAVVAVIFCVLVVALFVMQDQIDLDSLAGTGETTQDISNVMGTDTTADDTTSDTTADDTAADDTTADTTAEDTTAEDTAEEAIESDTTADVVVDEK